MDESDGDKLKFSRNTYETGSNDVLTITQSETVGIGTTEPKSKLEVD